MSIDTIFFELLQVAIGTRKSLTAMPTSREWALLYDMATKQALVGICFVGCQKTLSSSPLKGENLPELLRLKWLGMAAKIQQRNHVLNEECARVCREFAHDGVQCVVLKGQSNLVYYPEELREARTAGDIDLWCSVPEGVEVAHEVNGVVEKREYRGIEGVIEYCKQYERCQGREIPWHRVLYYHCEVNSPSGIGIEPHYRPTYLNSPLRNWRLQRWFRDNEQFGVCDAKIGDCTFPVPPVSYNAVYQLLHIYKHLFEGGVGLRQLLDYYFVLRALHIEQGSLSDRTSSMALWAEGMGISVKSNVEIMHVIGRFGLKRFAASVMYVLAHVFEPNDDDNPSTCSGQALNDDWASRWPWMICEPDAKEGEFLLQEILRAGNFGRYDERLKGDAGTGTMRHAFVKWKHNMRLLRHYPEEVLWEPVFRVYHWVWRRLELWRW